MKRVLFFCLTLLLYWSLSGPVQMASVPQQQSKQETFRNPAMEDQDEFHQALTKGRVLMHDGDVDGAVKEFRKAAALKNGQCAECFDFIAQYYFTNEKYKDAAIAYKQAIALKPGNEAELNNALGVSIYQQGDKKTLEEAVAAFNRAIELSDGKTKSAWDCDPGMLKVGTTHHVVITVDAGPKIIMFVVDGILCDGGGGSLRQFGWARFDKSLADINGSPLRQGKLSLLRIYNRPLRTSEAVANFNSTR